MIEGRWRTDSKQWYDGRHGGGDAATSMDGWVAVGDVGEAASPNAHETAMCRPV
jgi:hypothetical protein